MSQLKLLSFCTLLICMMLPSLSTATSPQPPEAAKSVGPHPRLLDYFLNQQAGETELERLMKQRQLIQNQIETAKLRAELDRLTGGTSQELPKIIAIMFVDQTPRALLQLGDNQQLIVEQGDDIEGHGKVTHITKQGVKLEQSVGKKVTEHRLPMAMGAAPQSLPDSNNPMLRAQ